MGNPIASTAGWYSEGNDPVEAGGEGANAKMDVGERVRSGRTGGGLFEPQGSYGAAPLRTRWGEACQ